MKTIAIIAFDNFTDIDVYLAWDLFNRIRVRDKEWTIKILGTEKTHLSSTSLPLHIHGMVEEASAADVVFFSSGFGTRKLIKDQQYLNRFNLDPEKQIICSMCSGSLILAALGLLDGVPATTYPSAIGELKSYGVEVVEKDLVIQGNIATAAGCLAAVNLVGWIVERIADKELSEDVMASVLPVGKGLECLY